MPKKISHYEVLDVNENADAEQIKKAYRNLVRTSHPDKIPGFNQLTAQEQKNLQDKFSAISEAYLVLTDAQLRAAYDANPNRNSPEQVTECSIAIKHGDIEKLEQLHQDSYIFEPRNILQAFYLNQHNLTNWIIEHCADVNAPIIDVESGRHIYCLPVILDAIIATRNKLNSMQMNMQMPDFIYNDRVERVATINALQLTLQNQTLALAAMLKLPNLNINQEFDIKVTINETVTTNYQNEHGRVVNTRVDRYSKDYAWRTTVVGFAMFNKEKNIISTMLANYSVDLENILIPASGRNEKYLTALEYAAKESMNDVLNMRLNIEYCKNPPTLSELQSAIYYAESGGQYTNYIELNDLSNYRKQHYGFNIFKFGYNHKWQANVDLSWGATIRNLPHNLIQALRDGVYALKQLFNAVFSWSGLAKSVFAVAIIISTGLFIQGLIAISKIPYQSLAENLFGLLMITYFSVDMGLLMAYQVLEPQFVNFMQSNVNPIFANARDFIYSIGLKVINMFTANPSTPKSENNHSHEDATASPQQPKLLMDLIHPQISRSPIPVIFRKSSEELLQGAEELSQQPQVENADASQSNWIPPRLGAGRS